nr:D-alanyl-D-alanine carboxypeptidase [Eubacterium sp.]
NDAAVALAEYVSGSVSAFAELMNQTATSMGATNSHFVNPNGLTDPDHYTTVYDLYLIFHAALKNQDFYDLITTTEYTAEYHDASGAAVTNSWHSTCRYLSGSTTAPDGVTVLGGKTGTTTAAGSCLVLLSQNSDGDSFISVVLASQTRDNLYILMNQLLSIE